MSFGAVKIETNELLLDHSLESHNVILKQFSLISEFSATSIKKKVNLILVTENLNIKQIFSLAFENEKVRNYVKHFFSK